MLPIGIAVSIFFLVVVLVFLSDAGESLPMCTRLNKAGIRLRDLLWAPRFLSHWQFMLPFFSLPVARLFITWFALVPIAAHLLSNAPETLKIPQRCDWVIEFGSRPKVEDLFHSQSKIQSQCTYIDVPIGLPFNWKLLWFASLLFFIAFVIHSIACPKFIRRYPNFGAYLAEGHAVRWMVWEFYYMDTPHNVRADVERRLIVKGYASKSNEESTGQPNVVKECTYLVFTHQQENYRFASPSSKADEVSRDWERDVFWEVFGGWAKSRPIFAWAIRQLLRGAMLLTAYVVCENIAVALKYLVAPLTWKF
jgi:hypothetical protein